MNGRKLLIVFLHAAVQEMAHFILPIPCSVNLKKTEVTLALQLG